MDTTRYRRTCKYHTGRDRFLDLDQDPDRTGPNWGLNSDNEILKTIKEVLV